MKKTGHIEAIVKHTDMTGTYNMKGQILILPISGSGPFQCTFDDVKLSFTFEYNTYEKEGQKHFKFLDSKLDWSAGKSHYQFENLFNGDKNLGKLIRNFLNILLKFVFRG